jgi:hypothetical protein
MLLFIGSSNSFGEFQTHQRPVSVKSPHTRYRKKAEKMSKVTGYCARLGYPDVYRWKGYSQHLRRKQKCV